MEFWGSELWVVEDQKSGIQRSRKVGFWGAERWDAAGQGAGMLPISQVTPVQPPKHSQLQQHGSFDTTPPRLFSPSLSKVSG